MRENKIISSIVPVVAVHGATFNNLLFQTESNENRLLQATTFLLGYHTIQKAVLKYQIRRNSKIRFKNLP